MPGIIRQTICYNRTIPEPCYKQLLFCLSVKKSGRYSVARKTQDKTSRLWKGLLIVTNELALLSLNNVLDPELGIGLVDLGLIYQVDIDDMKICVTMTMTSVACPMHVQLSEQARVAVAIAAGKDYMVEVKVVHDPPWSADRMSPEAKIKLGWQA